MPTQFSGTTFSTVYRDDYKDSDGYHRILFNSGRALQARELTQLQTILQNQITRFARNVFLDGASVNPKSGGSGPEETQYVIVEELFDTPDSYIGQIFQSQSDVSGRGTNGIQFQITKVLPAADGDFPTLYGRYISANQSGVSNDVQTTAPIFEEADILSDVTGSLSALTVRTQPPESQTSSVGKALLFNSQSSEFFVQGFFVFSPAQSIVVGKYSPTVDADVGFEVSQDIVTALDDDALYDNQGARPNISSPGADRYRILLTLTTRDAVADALDFVPFATLRGGNLIQVKEGTDSFNQIEKRMAIRQNDTTGNFLANPFNIQIMNGDSSDQLKLKVDGITNGVVPTAFVDGYRLENRIPKTFNVKKPISFTADSNTGTQFSYGGYVNVPYDSATSYLGTFGTTSDLNLDLQPKFVLSNNSQTAIGTARIKHIEDTEDVNEGYRFYLYDIRMKAGQNFRNVDFIRRYDQTSADQAVFKLEEGNLFQQEADFNHLLFAIPGPRLKSLLGPVIYTVQRQFTSTVDGGGNLNLTLNANEQVNDESRWIFINASTDSVESVPPSSFGGTAPAVTIAVSGTPSTDVYHVLGYVQKNAAQSGVKTYTESWVTSSLTTDSSGTFFSTNLYDGIQLLDAVAIDSAGDSAQNVFNVLSFDGGQRDNYYGKIRLNNNGVPSGVSSIKAKVAYFDWTSTGDFFSVNSYQDDSDFSYSDIPLHTTNAGYQFPLYNVLDFRHRLDPAADNMSVSDTREIPRNADNITYSLQYYNSRVDHVTVGYDPKTFETQIKVNSGGESIFPQQPELKQNEMLLYTVYYGGNTISPEDVFIQRHVQKRYLMSDINRLEERINFLEEAVSLSFLENDAKSLIELTSDGSVRSKTGFFVNDFTAGIGLSAGTQSSVYIEDPNLITSSIDPAKGLLYPRKDERNISLLFDSDNQFGSRTGGGNSNIVHKGDNLYLDYQSVLDPTMKQELISWRSDGDYEEHGYYNVNPYNVFTGEGFLELRPQTDHWVDIRRLPDNVINGGTNIVRTMGRAPWGNTNWWQWGWQGTTLPRGMNPENLSEGQIVSSTVVTTGGGTEKFSPPVTTSDVRDVVTNISTVQQNLGDKTISAFAIPFMRQRKVFMKAQGLRPNTRYWPFFDNISVSKWCVALTSSDYSDAIRTRQHLREWGDVNVNYKKHPDAIGATPDVLISDDDGTMYLSFWLPNNAPIPKNSTENSSLANWEAWVKDQKKQANRYGSVTDPLVYDAIGWKFRSGSKEFALYDVSSGKEEDSISLARAIYSSQGTMNLVQAQILTTRIATIERTVDERVRRQDPLAQTFAIDPQNGVPGAYITKVDIFLRRAPNSGGVTGEAKIPLQLQIRGVKNGTPLSGAISPQHRVYKSADDCASVIDSIVDLEDIDDVLSNPVTFEFEEPIYIRAGEEYAIVLLAECDKYEAFIAETYELILGKTDKRVNKQPAIGSLFLSQNGSTWTPKQNQDLAYRIYTAKFKQEGVANFYNNPLPKFVHNQPNTLKTIGGTGKYVVSHLGHGLGVGDKVELSGLNPVSIISGVDGNTIMDSAAKSFVVDSADALSYVVNVTGATFDSDVFFGTDSVTTNTAFPFDRANITLEQVNVPGSNINLKGSFVSGFSHAQINLTQTSDPRFNIDDATKPFSSGSTIFFENPKYLANPDQEFSEISTQGDSSPSIVIRAEFSSNQSSSFGGTDAIAISASGYVSDISPHIDTQRCRAVLVNYLIDNQPLDSNNSAGRINTNRPNSYQPETAAIIGSSISKHLTKVVKLSNAANGIKVLSNIHVPPAASIDLYYRTIGNVDQDIYAVDWTYIAPEQSPPKDKYVGAEESLRTYGEYTWLIGGTEGTLTDFVGFQLKVVMNTTNTCQIPIINNIRAIALI